MSWPFDDPPNTACFTSADVLDRNMPIVSVFHHAEDGAWEFQSVNGAPDDARDARLVALDEMLSLDSTVAEIADLPLGWCAWREAQGGPWRRDTVR